MSVAFAFRAKAYNEPIPQPAGLIVAFAAGAKAYTNHRRDPNTWQNLTTAPASLITDRGFTGHEHLDGFKLINMNGRVYYPPAGQVFKCG